MTIHPIIGCFLLFVFMAKGTATFSEGHSERPGPEMSCCVDGQTQCGQPLFAGISADFLFNCPCDHDKGGHHCPDCNIICHTSAVVVPEWQQVSLTPPISNLQKRTFYFSAHLPEAVYLPIWQPPKIGA
ncbi:MAG: hypothetical protein H6565_09795 [Lewinellaceae bacterium]|nr:hypothetical protein [Saprospiraceae bacterium]MCB0542163.1 hypothetical protein [Saprospiraceae bacterium]MCB9306878.1 hypothetical protein [Lewinellaceae bacterium]MCB9356446.1 hypothetical protein [Lewinellaceae bacterium]